MFVYLFNGGKKEGEWLVPRLLLYSFCFNLSVYSLFKDLRCTLWFYEMHSYIYWHTHFLFHFLICSMRFAFLDFYSFSILPFINEGFLSSCFLVNCLLGFPFFILLLLFYVFQSHSQSSPHSSSKSTVFTTSGPLLLFSK